MTEVTSQTAAQRRLIRAALSLGDAQAAQIAAECEFNEAVHAVEIEEAAQPTHGETVNSAKEG